jgi:hypothetical protein
MSKILKSSYATKSRLLNIFQAQGSQVGLQPMYMFWGKAEPVWTNEQLKHRTFLSDRLS